MLSDRDACELSAQGWAIPCLWGCLEGVGEEGQKEATLDHWFEAALNFSHCLCCFSVSGGLSGAQRDVVTLSSWKDQGVLLMVGFRGLLKTTSWQSVLPSFQQTLQTSSSEINISPFQRLKRSDKGLNITTQSWWMTSSDRTKMSCVILSKSPHLSEPRFSLLNRDVDITCCQGCQEH